MATTGTKVRPSKKDRAVDGRLIIRAESRPKDATSYFTMRGDSATGIGDGTQLHWDFSNSDDLVTDSLTTPIPSGHKRKRIKIVFVDSVWVKEGTLYFESVPHGCYIDFFVVCPQGGYYLDHEGTPRQASADTPISHYVNMHRMFGSCPMGDELNTEAANENAIPAGYEFWVELTTPNSDSISKGNAELELYRIRTCLLPGEEI